MPAKLALKGYRNLVVAQLGHGALELRHGVAGREPAQFAALGCRRIIRVNLGQLGKVGTADDTFAEAGKTFARIVVGHAFLRLDEDVACARLLDRRLVAAAALVEQLHYMKAVGAAQNIGDLICLQCGQCFQKNGRQST